MKNKKSTTQFFEPLLAVSPQHFYAYREVFKNIILNSHTDTNDERETSAGIRYILNEDGEKVQISNSETTPENSYGVVHLIGPMVKYGNWWFWGADEIVAMLDRFDADPNIKGIILKIDSGGGQVVAVAPYIDFFNRKQKPVIGLGDTVGSAAFWVGAATDYLIADNNISAMFGSIGTMINFLSFEKYYKGLGIEEHTVYSDHSEDKNKPFELALKGEYELIKTEHLNPLAITFQEDIKRFRGSKLKQDTPGILSGKMFYATEALENGLISAIGNEQLAIEKINELASVHNYINNF